MRRSSRPWMAAVILATSTLALATTVVEVDTAALITHAERVIHATCTDKTTYVDKQNRIVSRYRFTVWETLKGKHLQVVDVVQPGGEYRGLTTVIPGLSRHKVGDEMVLFLGATSATSQFCMPVGLDQGLYRVVSDPVRGKVVRRKLDGLRIVRPGQNQQPRDLLPEDVGIDAFKQVLRARIGALQSDK